MPIARSLLELGVETGGERRGVRTVIWLEGMEVNWESVRGVVMRGAPVMDFSRTRATVRSSLIV